MTDLLNTTLTTSTASLQPTTSALAAMSQLFDTGNSTNIYWRISNSYRPNHGWLSTLVCLLGIPCNLLNIIVLTRPNMISSPTNLILTGLAFSDLLTMLSYLPYTIYFYILFGAFKSNEEAPERDTKFWVHYNKLHVIVTITFHCMSIWLTVYLACFRYFYLVSASPSGIVNNNLHNSHSQNQNINKPNNNNNKNFKVNKTRSNFLYVFQRCLLQCRTYRFNLICIIVICWFCVLICIPAYVWPRVVEKEVFTQLMTTRNQTNHNSTAINTFIKVRKVFYVIEGIDIPQEKLVYKLMFYSQAIFAKFIPCILLVTFSTLLIHSLVIINRNNKKLNESSSYSKDKLKNKSYEPKQILFKTNSNNNGQVNANSVFLLKKRSSTITIKIDSINNDSNENFENLKNQTIIENEIINAKVQFSANKGENIEVTSEDKNPAQNKNHSIARRFSDLKNSQKLARMLKKNAAKNSSNQEDKSLKTLLISKKVSMPTTLRQKRSRGKENLRTTLMLVIVCILFLITEFPQSVLLINGPNNRFYSEVYVPLGELMDIIALINNSINFLLYCTMSRAFRMTFCTLMLDSVCVKWLRAYCMGETQCKNCKKKPAINSNNFSVFTANSAFGFQARVNQQFMVENQKVNNNNNENDVNKNDEILKEGSETREINNNNNDGMNESDEFIELKPLIKEDMGILNSSLMTINKI